VARFLIPLVPIWWILTCAWLARVELRARLATRRAKRDDQAFLAAKT
jgi:hypothetical protein